MARTKQVLNKRLKNLRSWKKSKTVNARFAKEHQTKENVGLDCKLIIATRPDVFGDCCAEHAIAPSDTFMMIRNCFVKQPGILKEKERAQNENEQSDLSPADAAVQAEGGTSGNDGHRHADAHRW